VSGSGISWAICKSAPCPRQITMPAPHQSFFTGQMPFLLLNQQLQSTEGIIIIQYVIITSAEEGGYVFGSVCLSVCPSDYSQTCEQILTKFFARGRAWLKDQVIQFWWRSGSRFGSVSPKSEIRILWIGGGLCSLSASCLLYNNDAVFI